MFYRYDAPLFFANIGDLRERVHKLLALENQAYPDSPVRWFVLNVEANIEIDITAADGLRELARELADSGIHLGLARVKNDLYVPLHRAGVIDDDRQGHALRHLAGRRGELPALGPGPRAGPARGDARRGGRR